MSQSIDIIEQQPQKQLHTKIQDTDQDIDLFAIFDDQTLSYEDPTQKEEDDLASMLTKQLYQSVKSNKIVKFNTAKEQPQLNFFDDAQEDAHNTSFNLDFDKMFDQQEVNEDDIFSSYNSSNKNAEESEDEVNPLDLTFTSGDNEDHIQYQSKKFSFSLVKPHALKKQVTNFYLPNF